MNGRARRQHRIVTAVALVVTVVTVAFLLVHTSAKPSAAPPVATMTELAPSGAATDPVGPRSHSKGVPIGWRHDEAGATGAARAYVRTRELIAAVGPLERQDIIATFTTANSKASLAAATNSQLDDLLFALGGRDHGLAELTWREFPLALHVDAESADHVTLEVWSVSVVWVAGGSVARQTWHTDELSLVWQDGDWKVDRWESKSGPTPGLPSDIDLSSVSSIQVIGAWTSIAAGGS